MANICSHNAEGHNTLNCTYQQAEGRSGLRQVEKPTTRLESVWQKYNPNKPSFMPRAFPVPRLNFLPCGKCRRVTQQLYGLTIRYRSVDCEVTLTAWRCHRKSHLHWTRRSSKRGAQTERRVEWIQQGMSVLINKIWVKHVPPTA